MAMREETLMMPADYGQWLVKASTYPFRAETLFVQQPAAEIVQQAVG
jgi:hypothetical protein